MDSAGKSKYHFHRLCVIFTVLSLFNRIFYLLYDVVNFFLSLAFVIYTNLNKKNNCMPCSIFTFSIFFQAKVSHTMQLYHVTDFFRPYKLMSISISSTPLASYSNHSIHSCQVLIRI